MQIAILSVRWSCSSFVLYKNSQRGRRTNGQSELLVGDMDSDKSFW